MPEKYARIVTLGCRLNHADSALLASRLEKQGFTLIDDPGLPVDLIVVNSCAVTAEAEAKSRRQLSRLRREHPEAQITVTGCAAELHADALLASGADLALTNCDKRRINGEPTGVKSIDLAAEPFQEKTVALFPFRTRAFIKIQEGCDNFCTYCIVPVVRGPSRSRDFAEALADCRHSIDAGFPELVLTGVNTCNYSDHGHDLADLIRAILALPGEFRLRLGSTEPHPGDMTLPQLMAADPRICRFLHLSMQHGSDRILKLMHRHYNAAEFADSVAEARKLVPGLHVGTDFIVGFPGETEKDFAEALEVVKRIGFANIHGFAYSPRPGTPAAEMPGRVPPAAVRERMEELRKVAEASALDFARSQYGKILPVIFERSHGGKLCGWSDNYLELRVPEASAPCGKIVTVTASAENTRAHNDTQA